MLLINSFSQCLR